jgi:hypothetical protein
MKKFITLLAFAALLSGNVAQAQTNTPNRPPAPKTNVKNDDFCWGIGLVGLAVIGTVVGLTAASAASSPVSYSNTK